MSVYEDDYRYEEWPSRKPSKSSKLAAKIREHPVDYALDRATKVATSKSRTISRSVARKVGGASAGAVVAGAATAAAVAAILAAGYVVADRIATNGRLKLGEKLNAISQRFVETQRQLTAAFGKRWDDVPQDVRSKALADYKRAIATASSQAQGSAFAGTRAVGSYK